MHVDRLLPFTEQLKGIEEEPVFQQHNAQEAINNNSTPYFPSAPQQGFPPQHKQEFAQPHLTNPPKINRPPISTHPTHNFPSFPIQSSTNSVRPDNSRVDSSLTSDRDRPAKPAGFFHRLSRTFRNESPWQRTEGGRLRTRPPPNPKYA